MVVDCLGVWFKVQVARVAGLCCVFCVHIKLYIYQAKSVYRVTIYTRDAKCLWS